MHYFITAIRVFNIIVFTFGAGLALALAIKQRHQKFRIWLLLAFAFMMFGVMSATVEKLVAHSPWNWATTPFIFVSAILVVVTVIVAYKDHFK